MKVILPTIGSMGDLNPVLAIAQTLQARGHSPLLMANDLFAEVVRAAGISFAPLGSEEQARAVMDDPDLWHPRKGFATVARGAILPAIGALLEELARHDPRDTVIAAHSLALGAQIAREAYGFRLASLLFAPSLLRSAYDAPVQGVALPGWLPPWAVRLWYSVVDRAVVDPVLARGVNAQRAALGLPPQRALFGAWLHSAQRVLALFPPWFAPPPADWPQSLRYCGFPLYDPDAQAPLSAPLRAFLDAGEPPVLVTFGSAMRGEGAPFQAAVEGARRLGKRVVVVTHASPPLPPAPADTVHLEPYAPFSRLMPQVAAAIHHGGVGTVAQALAAGVPQLVVPLSHDQPDNARRIARLGVGAWLPPSRATGARVAIALRPLLADPQLRATAGAFATQLDGDAARACAARQIEALEAEPFSFTRDTN